MKIDIENLRKYQEEERKGLQEKVERLKESPPWRSIIEEFEGYDRGRHQVQVESFGGLPLYKRQTQLGYVTTEVRLLIDTDKERMLEIPKPIIMQAKLKAYESKPESVQAYHQAMESLRVKGYQGDEYATRTHYKGITARYPSDVAKILRDFAFE